MSSLEAVSVILVRGNFGILVGLGTQSKAHLGIFDLELYLVICLDFINQYHVNLNIPFIIIPTEYRNRPCNKVI